MKEIEPISTSCFACGQANSSGLRMRFFSDGERITSTLAVPAHLRGWGDIAHGGIVSTILDEVMAWTALHLTRRFVLTRNMRVTFLRPVRIETPLQVVGRVLERRDERLVIVGAEIRASSGQRSTEICARGRGEYALFDREGFEQLGIVPRELVETFARVLGFED